VVSLPVTHFNFWGWQLTSLQNGGIPNSPFGLTGLNCDLLKLVAIYCKEILSSLKLDDDPVVSWIYNALRLMFVTWLKKTWLGLSSSDYIMYIFRVLQYVKMTLMNWCLITPCNELLHFCVVLYHLDLTRIKFWLLNRNLFLCHIIIAMSVASRPAAALIGAFHTIYLW